MNAAQCCHIWGNFGSKRGIFLAFWEILGWPIFLIFYVLSHKEIFQM